MDAIQQKLEALMQSMVTSKKEHELLEVLVSKDEYDYDFRTRCNNELLTRIIN